MASCVRNIHTKNYQNLVIGYQVIVKNVGDVFRHSVYTSTLQVLIDWPIECNKNKQKLKVTDTLAD